MHAQNLPPRRPAPSSKAETGPAGGLKAACFEPSLKLNQNRLSDPLQALPDHADVHTAAPYSGPTKAPADLRVVARKHLHQLPWSSPERAESDNILRTAPKLDILAHISLVRSLTTCIFGGQTIYMCALHKNDRARSRHSCVARTRWCCWRRAAAVGVEKSPHSDPCKWTQVPAPPLLGGASHPNFGGA